MRLLALAALLLALAAGAVAGSASSAVVTCARWAAPFGDDNNAGTRVKPFGTLDKLASSLRPGQTGCLEPGATFEGHAVIDARGAAGAPIRIMSAPGGRAVLNGGVEFLQSAQYVTLENVVVGAKDNPANQYTASAILRGFAVRLSRSEINGGSVVGIGRSCVLVDHGRRTTIDHNTIHDCGGLRSGATGQYHAGITVSIAVNATISDNTIFGNNGDGIALTPDAQRSVVTRNLVTQNDAGVYFSGGAKMASRDNTVTRNVIALNRRFAVHGSYQPNAPVGIGNSVRANCLWASAEVAGTGFAPVANRTVNPHVQASPTGYRVPLTSPCKGSAPRP